MVLLVVLFATAGFGQDCIAYGTPASLAGTLFVQDEAGYNRYTAVDLAQPICTSPDPAEAAKPDAQPEPAHRGVRVLQAAPCNVGDAASARLGARLDRLAGYRVRIRGSLHTPWSGYYRTDVWVCVDAVDPVDAAGLQAMRVAKPKFRPKDVAAYDVIINAGKRSVMEAHETGFGAPLLSGT